MFQSVCQQLLMDSAKLGFSPPASIMHFEISTDLHWSHWPQIWMKKNAEFRGKVEHTHARIVWWFILYYRHCCSKTISIYANISNSCVKIVFINQIVNDGLTFTCHPLCSLKNKNLLSNRIVEITMSWYCAPCSVGNEADHIYVLASRTLDNKSSLRRAAAIKNKDNVIICKRR